MILAFNLTSWAVGVFELAYIFYKIGKGIFNIYDNFYIQTVIELN